ncbi:MAG: Ig-like domain-containing protein, partial [Acidobacteriota bacterium]
MILILLDHFFLLIYETPVRFYPPAVKLISPAEGETVERGKPFTVCWKTLTANPAASSHKLEYSSGGNFQLLATLSGSAKAYDWNVPGEKIANAQLRITISEASRSGAATTIFKIDDKDKVPPTVRFLNPLGGERFNQGDNIMITWSSTDNIGVTSQDLTFSTDGGATFNNTLATGLNGSVQSFAFSIPNSLETSKARLRLSVRDEAGNTNQAMTSDFQIQKPVPVDKEAPFVKFNSPIGGEKFSQ